MPTFLPAIVRKKPDFVFVFLIALAAAMFAIEIIDPVPMDIEAAMVSTP